MNELSDNPKNKALPSDRKPHSLYGRQLRQDSLAVTRIEKNMSILQEREKQWNYFKVGMKVNAWRPLYQGHGPRVDCTINPSRYKAYLTGDIIQITDVVIYIKSADNGRIETINKNSFICKSFLITLKKGDKNLDK